LPERYQINEEIVAMSLEQPNRIADFTYKAPLSKVSHCGRGSLRGEKQIEVLGIATNSCVFAQGKGSGYGISDFLLFKKGEHLLKQSPLLTRNLAWRRRGLRQFRRLVFRTLRFGHGRGWMRAVSAGCRDRVLAREFAQFSQDSHNFEASAYREYLMDAFG
jgi:hypothetical protein